MAQAIERSAGAQVTSFDPHFTKRGRAGKCCANRLFDKHTKLMDSEEKTDTLIADEVTRVKLFLGIQVFFLVLSVFTGGFHFKLWSMLDTALLIQSIGVTSLVLVLEDARLRRFAFKTAIILYLLG